MQTTDFRSSYLWFEIDHTRAITVTTKQPVQHNQVRIPLECRCEWTTAEGQTTQYVLGASCKTEKVAVDSDIWMLPNADFCVVHSTNEFLIIKRWQECGLQISAELAKHQERQVGVCDEAWTSHKADVTRVEATVVEGDEIVAAVHNRKTLVSVTECKLSDGSTFLVEYPVKTINVSDQFGNYQVDTGPILLPDLEIESDRAVGKFRLAYVAHHQPDWSEFIVNVPTTHDSGIVSDHYSKPVRLDARNTMLALP